MLNACGCTNRSDVVVQAESSRSQSPLCCSLLPLPTPLKRSCGAGHPSFSFSSLYLCCFLLVRRNPPLGISDYDSPIPPPEIRGSNPLFRGLPHPAQCTSAWPENTQDGGLQDRGFWRRGDSAHVEVSGLPWYVRSSHCFPPDFWGINFLGLQVLLRTYGVLRTLLCAE